MGVKVRTAREGMFCYSEYAFRFGKKFRTYILVYLVYFY